MGLERREYNVAEDGALEPWPESLPFRDDPFSAGQVQVAFVSAGDKLGFVRIQLANNDADPTAVCTGNMKLWVTFSDSETGQVAEPFMPTNSSKYLRSRVDQDIKAGSAIPVENFIFPMDGCYTQPDPFTGVIGKAVPGKVSVAVASSVNFTLQPKEWSEFIFPVLFPQEDLSCYDTLLFDTVLTGSFPPGTFIACAKHDFGTFLVQAREHLCIQPCVCCPECCIGQAPTGITVFMTLNLELPEVDFSLCQVTVPLAISMGNLVEMEACGWKVSSPTVGPLATWSCPALDCFNGKGELGITEYAVFASGEAGCCNGSSGLCSQCQRQLCPGEAALIAGGKSLGQGFTFNCITLTFAQRCSGDSKYTEFCVVPMGCASGGPFEGICPEAIYLGSIAKPVGCDPLMWVGRNESEDLICSNNPAIVLGTVTNIIVL